MEHSDPRPPSGGLTLNLDWHALDDEIARVAADPRPEIIPKLACLCLDRYVLQRFISILPDDVISVLTFTGELGEAVGYADAAGTRVSQIAIARVLYAQGESEEARALVAPLMADAVGEGGRDGLLSALVEMEQDDEAEALAQALIRSVETREEDDAWGAWAQVARALADAGFWDEAVEAARRALQHLTAQRTALCADDDEGLYHCLLEDLLLDLRGLIAPAVGQPGIEDLLRESERIDDKSRRLTVLAVLADELIDLGATARAREVVSDILPVLSRSSASGWAFDDPLGLVVEVLVGLEDQERFALLLELVRMTDDGTYRGLCLIDCARALLHKGQIQEGVQILKEGAAALQSDPCWMTAHALARAACIMAESGWPFAAEEAFAIASAIPEDDDEHGGFPRGEALAKTAWHAVEVGYMDKAVALAHQARDETWRIARRLSWRCFLQETAACLVAAGEEEEAVRVASLALAAPGPADPGPDAPLDDAVLLRLVGREGEADRLVARAVAEGEAVQDEALETPRRAETLASLSNRLVDLGYQSLALRLAWDALEAVRQSDHRFPVHDDWLQVIGAFHRVGDPLGEHQAAVEALAATDPNVYAHGGWLWLLGELGVALARAGDADGFATVVDRVETSRRSSEEWIGTPAHLARGYLLLGESDEAAVLLDQGLRLARAQTQPLYHDVVMLAEGLVLAGRGREAAGLVQLPRMYPLSRALLGEVLAEAGMTEPALEALRRALADSSPPRDFLGVLSTACRILHKLGRNDVLVALVGAICDWIGVPA